MSDDRISLRIVGTNGAEVFFKVKRSTPFKKVFDAFQKRHKLDSRKFQLRFLIDGQRLKETHTPEDFKLQGEEVIDAVIFQYGG